MAGERVFFFYAHVSGHDVCCGAVARTASGFGGVYGMVWYGMVWYGMVWYGMVWYGMVWYGMVWYGKVHNTCKPHQRKRK